jgi:hypothetical protein
MNRTVRLSIALAALAVVTAAATGTADAASASSTVAIQDTTVSFARDILPIFEKSCSECHGGKDEAGDVFAEEDLHLTTYEGVMAGSSAGPVIEPGNVTDSFLYEMVEYGDMPAENDPLPPEELLLIKRWIEAGAPNN